jgi:hypothetical protein
MIVAYANTEAMRGLGAQRNFAVMENGKKTGTKTKKPVI